MQSAKFLTLFRVQKVLQITYALMMSQRPCSTVDSSCQILPGVLGDGDKKNDVVVCGSILKAKQHVIFFGGDVQNYPEEMKKHHPEHFRWNLISTAKMVHTSFRDSVVMVVKPAAMSQHTLSMYTNFLNLTTEGRPLFSDNFGGLHHIIKLHQNVRSKLLQMESNNFLVGDVTTTCTSDDCEVPVKLIAFSKGCVVLNQFVFELQTFKDNPVVKHFLEKVTDITWLDSGHTGSRDAWITDDDALKNLKDLNVKIHVHVTPYQIRDPNRRWIGREEAIFLEKLRKLRANVQEYPHFMDKAPSIENHFKLLQKI